MEGTGRTLGQFTHHKASQFYLQAEALCKPSKPNVLLLVLMLCDTQTKPRRAPQLIISM